MILESTKVRDKMQHKDTEFGKIGTCSIAASSSAAAIKIQKAFEKHRIPAEIGKATTASGCVYVISFPCIYRESADNVLSSHGLKHRGYL